MHSSTLTFICSILPILSLSASALATPRLPSLELASRNVQEEHAIRDARSAHVQSRQNNFDTNAHGLIKRKKKSKSKRSCAAETTTTAIPAVVAVVTTASASHSASTSSSVTDSDVETESETAFASATETASITSTYSSSAVSSTSTSTSDSSSTDSSSNSLFPWGTGSASWTTSDGSLSFSGALKPLSAGKLPSTGNAPDGSSALVASYPSGTVGLSSAGYSFYTEAQHNGVNVQTAKEVSFSYSVYFQDGFQFNKGGKMPGLYGGTSLSEAKSCSGGRETGRDSCFSARLMWRANGAGEIYDYLPVQYTGKDDGYGESINRGAYTWSTGEWQDVAIRVKLNDAGSANGEQELKINGETKISLTGVTFSTDASTKFYGIMAQTFFGGHTSDYASPQDQSAYFKDWSLAILA